jgi:hypothetical protein
MKVAEDGYSGFDYGKDNPDMERVPFMGPIPRGEYRIIWPHTSSKGPITPALRPVGHTAHERTDFLIHGDSINNPGNASRGCIILRRPVREAIINSGDRSLEVI